MSIASEITRLQNAKASIKTSIENKGVTVGDETLDSYASKIDAIETGITPTGTINITENGTYDVSDKASANVNVDADVSDYFTDTIKAGNSSVGGFVHTIKKLPTYTTVASDLTQAFVYYQGTTLPNIDTSNVTNMNGTFSRCYNLLSLPNINTSNVTNMNSMCYSDDKLEIIPLLDCIKVVALSYCFNGNSKLKTLGGFQNLGQAYSTTVSANYNSYELSLSGSTKLTHDSLMNVINNLYDIANKGCNTQRLTIGSTNMAKLTAEELAIGTSKGWSIS